MFNKIKHKIKAVLNKKLSVDALDLISIEPGDICIDCGANVGIVSKKFLEKKATVHAFEPNPYAYEKLLDNCKSFPNFFPHQKGVSDEEGEFNLYLHQDADQDQVKWSTGSSFLEEKSNVSNEKYVTVPVVKVSNFIKEQVQQKNVKVLKMDIEGLEYKVLEDLINTGVINQIEHVFVETHEHKIPSLKNDSERVRKLIDDKGLSNINLDWV